MRSKAFVAAATCVAALFAIAGCGSSDSGGGDSGASTIKVGASLPLSGPLAGFGSFVKWATSTRWTRPTPRAASPSTARRRRSS